MDDIARLPMSDRADLFAAAARQRGLTSAIIEKDFWVCWTLKRVFTLPDPPAELLFKGGTSLSKVFGVIERFSEDVDLSFDRAGLGFGGASDPLNATTGKRRKHGLEALNETCQRVTSYAAADFPDVFKKAECRVHVLAAERTFWEKATVLHMWHHAPEDKKFRDRQSRHYYDVVRLYQHELGRAAVKDIELLLSVARHKEVFFPAAWARYADARPGTLRLVPPDARLPELEQDYRKMREMIFGEPPAFEHLIEMLREIEHRVNRG